MKIVHEVHRKVQLGRHIAARIQKTADEGVIYIWCSCSIISCDCNSLPFCPRTEMPLTTDPGDPPVEICQTQPCISVSFLLNTFALRCTRLALPVTFSSIFCCAHRFLFLVLFR